MNGGSNHTLRGGTGSDQYIINSAITKSTRFTINQTDYKKKDADTLQLAKVSKGDVTYGLLDGTMTIKHKNGGAIAVTGWNKNKLSKIIFKNGTVKASAITKNAGPKTVTWNKGAKVSLNANQVASVLQINGHKLGDFVANLNNGQLVLREKGTDTGTLTISNWNNNTIGQIILKYGNYNKTLTAAEFKERIYTPVTLTDKQTYSGGLNVHQEFLVNFSTNTAITINSTSNTMDRIRFTNNGGWSNVHENIYRNGTDLIIGNWDNVNKKKLNGQITIKNFMNSSVKQVEYADQTYYLITKSGTYTGSDTYSDRFMILDWSKTTGNPDVGDWNITLDGVRNSDWIDLRMLPVNSQFYSMPGVFDGRDIVLNYWYSPDSNSDTKLGTLRLKNFFNADGTVNTTYGYPQVRINREFYTGVSNDYGPVWDRITGSSENYTNTEKDYRRAYLNAGTANADEVDLGKLQDKPDNRVWLYYAGDGNDTITAHAGDIVYGGNGDDVLHAEGRMSDIHGGAGNDTITVGGGVVKVNVYGEKGNDKIEAYGSYLYIGGGSGTDEIHLYDGNNSRVTGGNDNDAIIVHSGQNHLLYGGKGGDVIELQNGVTNCTAYGGAGEDTLVIQNGVTNCTAYGGDDTDTIYVYGENNIIYGGNGNDQMTVAGGSNNLYGNAGDDMFTVGGGTDIQLHGGSGSDQYVVSSGFEAANGLQIYQNIDYGFNDGDEDVLTLTGISKDNVEFEFQDNCLWIHGMAGETRIGSIAVNGWDENPLASINFADDVTMTTQQINALRT